MLLSLRKGEMLLSLYKKLPLRGDGGDRHCVFLIFNIFYYLDSLTPFA